MNDRDIIASQPDGYPRIIAIYGNDAERLAARRERLALTLDAIAASVRACNTGQEFEAALEWLHEISRDNNGYHGRTLRDMLAIDDANDGN